MGSKSGRKRRRRERNLGGKKSAPKDTESAAAPNPESVAAEQQEPEPEPVVESDPSDSGPADPGSGRPTPMEPGPVWTPLQAAPANHERTAVRQPDRAPEDPPERARVADPRTAVALGAQETLDAIQRLETRLDRLADWMSAYAAWSGVRSQAHQDVSRRAALHQRRVVALMLAICLPVMVLLAAGIRFSWWG